MAKFLLNMKSFFYSLLIIAIVAEGFNTRLYQQVRPVAIARSTGGGTAELNGSASYDPNKGGRIVSYKWAKVSGASISLINPDSAICKLSGARVGVYKFRLTVKDSEGGTASAETVIKFIY